MFLSLNHHFVIEIQHFLNIVITLNNVENSTLIQLFYVVSYVTQHKKGHSTRSSFSVNLAQCILHEIHEKVTFLDKKTHIFFFIHKYQFLQVQFPINTVYISFDFKY